MFIRPLLRPMPRIWQARQIHSGLRLLTESKKPAEADTPKKPESAPEPTPEPQQPSLLDEDMQPDRVLATFSDAKEPSKGENTARLYAFDTQKVYSNLRYAGYTRAQADIVMSVMRDMVDDVVEELEANCVPNATGENEAYLFDATSSEMRDETQVGRINQASQYRSTSARIQRDVEIMQHQANEMATLLKADMDMEMNERKNAARVEENHIQLKIQDLNHQITRLTTYLKSEIETLRWQLTRRGIVAIIVVAVATMFATSRTFKDDSSRKPRQSQETPGSEYSVPLLSPSIMGEEVDEPAIEELDMPEQKS